MGNIEKTLISNFELAETKDYLDITYILASSVPNLNGALFTDDELEKAKDSIINQPLIIVPDFGNFPTGHSIEDFPKISFGANIIGTHTASEIVEENGIKHLKVTARMWKIRYPEIASVITKLHSLGELKFSMECNYQRYEMVGSARSLKGVSFIGSAVVDEPANPYSVSVEVARLKGKEDKSMGAEKLFELEQEQAKCGDKEKKEKSAEDKMEKCPNCGKPKEECECKDEESKKCDDKDKKCGEKDEDKKKKCGSLEDEKASKEIELLTESLEKANARITELEKELASIHEKEELAKKEALKEERFNQIAEYLEFSEDEIEDKKETYAQLDEDVFNLILETAKTSKKVEKQGEVAGLDSDVKLKVNKKRLGYLDGLGEK